MSFTEFAAAEAEDHAGLTRMLRQTADAQYEADNISWSARQRLHFHAPGVARRMIVDAKSGARNRIMDQLRRHGSHDLSPHCTMLHGRPVRMFFDASAGWAIGYED